MSALRDQVLNREILSDVQVQRSWWQRVARVESGLVCTFETHHGVLRAMLLVRSLRVCVDREEACTEKASKRSGCI